MAFLKEADTDEVRGRLAEALAHDVKLVLFTQRFECGYCRETRDRLWEIEFPHLANRYGVMGVPRTVLSEDIHVEGAVPEPMLVARLPVDA